MAAGESCRGHARERRTRQKSQDPNWKQQPEQTRKKKARTNHVGETNTEIGPHTVKRTVEELSKLPNVARWERNQ